VPTSGRGRLFPKRRRFRRSQLWHSLVAFILLAGLRGSFPAAHADLSTDQLNRGVLASARIWAIDSQKKTLGSCAGTVVDPSGLVLTAWHCVGHSDLYGPDDSGLNLKHGDTYNPDGLVAVGFTQDARKAPNPQFFAKVVSGSPDIDIAVVKIVSTLNAKEPLPKSLPLTVMTLADSDQTKLGDPVVIFGYPGGSDTVTVSNGKVAGFDNFEYNPSDPKSPQSKPGGDPNIFKVDGAASYHGNSGGLLTNANGEQVGIPTAGGANPGISLERMVNFAVPYIKKAQGADVKGTNPPANPTPPPRQVGASPSPTPQRPGPSSTPQRPAPSATPPRPGPSATPAPGGGSGASFGPLVFGTSGGNSGVQNAGTQFPSGTPQISFGMPYQNMRNGASWGYTLRADGDLVLDKHDTESWNSGSTGNYCCIDITHQGGLPDGKFAVSLFLGGKEVQSGTFTVGNGGSTPAQPQPPTPPPPGKATGITITGKVADADTKRGIANATVIILKPGVSTDQFINSSDTEADALIAAAGTTDSSGTYSTAPGLEAGKTYSALIFASGYTGIRGDDVLKLDKGVPNPYPIKTIELKKR